MNIRNNVQLNGMTRHIIKYFEKYICIYDGLKWDFTIVIYFINEMIFFENLYIYSHQLSIVK